MAKKGKQPEGKKPADQGPRIVTVADNRRARFNYEILEHIEAGIALTGTEIKSVRAGRVNLRDAYAVIRQGQAWLMNLHIASWESGGPWNHEPLRTRRLLLHRSQIIDLARRAGQKGLTLVPLRMYMKGHHAKVELGLAKGRRQYDKRKAIQRRETEREIGRAIRQAI
jgi:SsrA-binding protein